MTQPSLTDMNLDRFCAERGYQIADAVASVLGNDAKKAENLIRMGLAVLQDQGPYAFILFCRSRGSGEEAGAKKLEGVTKDLLVSRTLRLIGDGDFLEEIRKEDGLASNLDKLLFACQVLEQALIYARYHAKAMRAGSQSNQKDGGA